MEDNLLEINKKQDLLLSAFVEQHKLLQQVLKSLDSLVKQIITEKATPKPIISAPELRKPVIL